MANILEIIIKAVKQGTGFGDAERDAKKLESAVGGLNKVLGAAGLAIGTKELFEFGKASVEAAREAAAAEAELQAALTSSGQASAEYKTQLEGLATALENTSLFSDEAIISAQASLVTFRNLGQDIMPRTIATVVDMGQKMGDLGSAAQLAGIALNAPEQAAARLQRQGILLTDQQKEQIAAMVEAGNVAGAQGIILDVLAQKFGGQAEAARKAAGGWMDSSVAMGRFQEEFGKLLIALGDTGAADATVTVLDQLAAGAKSWVFVISEAGPAIEQHNREVMAASEGLREYGTYLDHLKGVVPEVADATAEAAAAAAAELEALGPLTSSLQAMGNISADVTDAMDPLTRGIMDQENAAADAATATDAYAARMRGLAGALQTMEDGPELLRDMAGATDELTAAQLAAADAYGALANAQTAQAAGAFGGQQDPFTQNLSLIQLQQANDARVAAQEEQQKKDEQTAKDQQALAKKSSQEMGQAIKDATKDLATDISSAVSDAVSGVNQDVIGDLMGLENAEANAGEAVRRMAAVAGGGIMDEWAPSLAAQLTGVQDKTAQAFVTAFSTGDDTALKAAAQELALNPIVELFDAQLIANQVEQKLKTEGLQQALNDKVNAILGEKGLPAVQSVTQQVGDAVTTTGDAATTVGTDMAGVATSTETAMGQVTTSLNGTLLAIDTVTLRIKELVKAIERVTVVAGEAGAAIGGLNPPAASGAGFIPNGAQKKMGGPTPQ